MHKIAIGGFFIIMSMVAVISGFTLGKNTVNCNDPYYTIVNCDLLESEVNLTVSYNSYYRRNETVTIINSYGFHNAHTVVFVNNLTAKYFYTWVLEYELDRSINEIRHRIDENTDQEVQLIVRVRHFYTYGLYAGDDFLVARLIMV